MIGSWNLGVKNEIEFRTCNKRSILNRRRQPVFAGEFSAAGTITRSVDEGTNARYGRPKMREMCHGCVTQMDGVRAQNRVIIPSA